MTRFSKVLLPCVAFVLTAAGIGAQTQEGPASEAGNPAVRCEPWVTDAYNNAFAAVVGGRRPGAAVPLTSCIDFTASAGEARQALPFQSVDDYQAPASERPTSAQDASRDERTAEVREGARRARLNEIVVVRVQNLQTLWERAQCIDVAATAAARGKGAPDALVRLDSCRSRDILLFLGNRPIVGLAPEAISIDAATQSGTLRYHLARTDASKEVWADLLGLDVQGAGFSRDVRLSVGFEDSEPIPSRVEKFHLTRIRGWWLTTWLVLGGLLLYAFYRAMSESDLLRDRYPHVEWGQKRPFSLAHCQGAWWTGLTLYALAFIWLVTGQRDFSMTALGLLGITAGTAMGARLIDASRNSSTVASDPVDALKLAAMQKALDEKLVHEKKIAEADKKILSADEAGPAERAAAMDAYQTFLVATRRAFPDLIAPPSRGLTIDVLSDGNGVSFHRFQMVAWSALLGLMFAVEVLGRLAMPEFEPNLLALLGLSSGTYLGLKIPERS